MEFNEALHYGAMLGYAARLLRSMPLPGVEPEDLVHQAWIDARLGPGAAQDSGWFPAEYTKLYIRGITIRAWLRHTGHRATPLQPWHSGPGIEDQALTSVELANLLPRVLADRDGALLLALGMGHEPHELRAHTDQGKVAFSQRLARARRRILEGVKPRRGRLQPVDLGGY